MKTSDMPNECIISTDDSCNWPQVGRVVGPCLRPGGVILTERALEFCKLPPGARIADVGCGAGGTLEYLEKAGKYDLVGVDRSEELLSEAAGRLGSVRLLRGRAEQLPLQSGSFDAVFCECVFSILEDRVAAFRECSRVLKAGGLLIASDVFHRSAARPVEPGGQNPIWGKPRLIGKDDIIDPLAELGFSLLLWEEHDRLLKAFAARMILAGEPLPCPWGCGVGRKDTNLERGAISYFLLVAQK